MLIGGITSTALEAERWAYCGKQGGGRSLAFAAGFLSVKRRNGKRMEGVGGV